MENNCEIEQILKKYNQTNLINMMDKFSEEENNKIINQLQIIDLSKITELYNKTKQRNDVNSKNITHISYVDKAKLTSKETEEYRKAGEDIIKSGAYAVVTMAGGQGTRLGHKGPKGTFKVVVNNEEKYLFQIIVESLKQAEKEYRVVIPWYIMVSDENEKDTKDFLKEHNFFGYQE